MDGGKGDRRPGDLRLAEQLHLEALGPGLDVGREQPRAIEELHLADVGIEVEVIDPVTLKPLDVATIQDSAEKTGRLLVVDNAWLGCGASAEIIASVTERSEQAIRVKRVGFTEITCPTTPSLEAAFYPNPISIAKAAMAMIDPERAAHWQPDEVQAQLVYQQQFRGPF